MRGFNIRHCLGLPKLKRVDWAGFICKEEKKHLFGSTATGCSKMEGLEPVGLRTGIFK